MEEPVKSGKGAKKRAAKTVIGTRERRTQDEPVVERDAVGEKAEAETGCDGMTGVASGAGQAVGGGRKRESTGSAEAAARGRSKARAGPETSAVRKRRRAGSVTGDVMPVVAAGWWGRGLRELVGGARLDLAGASKARVSGGKGGVRAVAASSEARARRVAVRRQTSGQGQG